MKKKKEKRKKRKRKKRGKKKRKIKRKKKEKKKKRMAFLVAPTSFPAVYRPNGFARTTTAGTTTAGTPHARANCYCDRNANMTIISIQTDCIDEGHTNNKQTV